MRTMFLLLKERGRWAQVLNAHVDEAVQTYQLPLVAPLAKVTVPAPSKHINRITTTMITKTYPWTRFQLSSLGPFYLLVLQLKWASSRWWTTRGGLTMCTRNGTLIPLFGKSNLMRTLIFG
jgi:hypothetical protein